MVKNKDTSTTADATIHKFDPTYVDKLNEKILAITLDSIGDGVISTDQKGHINSGHSSLMG